jgi:two-component system sensor histidine kinase DesK
MRVDQQAPGSEVPVMVARWPGAEDSGVSGAGHEAASLGEDLFDRWVRADRPWLRVLYRLGWSGIWLVFVGYAISDILDKHWDPLRTALAWASLVLFAVLYMLTMWLATAFQPVRRQPLHLVLYTLFLALTLALTLIFGGNFGGLLIYAGVVTGWTFQARVATPILALLGAFIFSGLAVGYAISDVLFDAFMTMALGATMMFFRGVIWLTIELRAAREEMARLAVAEERLRFSRDLHDVLGHSLSVIALKSQVARRLLRRDPQAAEAALGDLEVVAHDSIAAVREMVTGYRQRSLADELQSAAEVLRAAGIAPQVGDPGMTLDDSSDSLLAWSVREGITNVLRHSGARHCRISIRPEAGGVILEILDDGRGAAAAPQPGGGGSGLRGLRERLAAANGSLEAGARPEGGFRLAVRVPAT